MRCLRCRLDFVRTFLLRPVRWLRAGEPRRRRPVDRPPEHCAEDEERDSELLRRKTVVTHEGSLPPKDGRNDLTSAALIVASPIFAARLYAGSEGDPDVVAPAGTPICVSADLRGRRGAGDVVEIGPEDRPVLREEIDDLGVRERVTRVRVRAARNDRETRRDRIEEDPARGSLAP